MNKFLKLIIINFTLIIIEIFFFGCKSDPDENIIINPPLSTNRVTLLEPANNAIVNTYTPLIKWQQFNNAEFYNFLLSTDANFITNNLVDTSVAANEYIIPLGKLTTNISYYWKVKAKLNNGIYTEWSEIRRFSVILNPPPPPQLLLPQNNSLNQHYLPFFDWTDSPTAVTYRLQLSLNQSFIPVLLDTSGITVSELHAPYFYINTGTLYYWRVNASNSNGVSTSNWSEIFNFTTVEGPTPSSVSGLIRFADTNFITFPGYYVAAAFRTDNWPPGIGFMTGYTDSLTIFRSGNDFFANYKIRNIPNGNYYVTVFSYDIVLSNNITFKSVYGCDTARVQFSNCAFNPTPVSIINGAGVVNINMLSWADSNKSIF